MNKSPKETTDPEIAAISSVYGALKDLQADAQERVLTYVSRKLKIVTSNSDASKEHEEASEENASPPPGAEDGEATVAPADDLGAISPIAKKWMTRNGLQAPRLESVFSLGVDEIDLIATKVPGKNKKERMRSVFLLKGVAAYLGTGAARFTHEQMKSTCLHYDGFDSANFATYYKSLSSEVTGGKAEGYTLTPRGLAAATEMVKSMTKASAG
jgi:hypothetical protein